MQQSVSEYTTATRVFTRIALAPNHVKRAALSADKLRTYVSALTEMNKCVVRIGMRVDAACASNPATNSDPLVAMLERTRETWTLLCNAAQLAGITAEPLFVPINEFPKPAALPTENESSKPCCNVCGFPLVSNGTPAAAEPCVHSSGQAHSPCFILSQLKS